MEKLNSTTWKEIPKDNPKDLIEVVLGDDKSPEIQPQAKIQRWDNECNVSIRLKDFKDFSVKEENGKLKLESSKRDLHLYNTNEGEGAFEIEVILKEKPATNVIEFTLEDKDVDYFYQPELTQEEKDQGANRPENVVGSYAVYASENKINYVGGKEYKCGKVGHIFRPLATNATGGSVYCDLNLDKGILKYIIPQEFLDNSPYPISIK